MDRTSGSTSRISTSEIIHPTSDATIVIGIIEECVLAIADVLFRDSGELTLANRKEQLWSIN